MNVKDCGIDDNSARGGHAPAMIRVGNGAVGDGRGGVRFETTNAGGTECARAEISDWTFLGNAAAPGAAMLLDTNRK